MKATAYNLKAKLGIFILSLMLALALSIGTSNAQNVEGSVKAVNVLGYEYVNQNTVKVFFDKGLVSLDKGQFKIQHKSTEAEVSISSITTAGGSGWSNPAAPGGTTVILTTATALSADTEYNMIVSSTIQMGNAFRLTVGNYLQHQDVKFIFKTPTASGNYTGAATLQPIVPSVTIGQGMGESNHVSVISSIPLDPTSIDLSQVKLQKNGVDLIMDTTFDSIKVTGAECYVAQMNTANTCVFLPLTAGGQASVVYNLTENTSYKMIIPSTVKTISQLGVGNLESNFNIGTATAATTGTTILDATAPTLNSVSLSWTNVEKNNSGEKPVGYKVYYSTNPYFNFVASNDAVINNGTTSSCTVTGLNSATTYYFRVVPLNIASEEGGFSPYTIQATN